MLLSASDLTDLATAEGGPSLAAPEALASLFPQGRLARGISIGVMGSGGWSLAMALVGAALGDDGWMVGVGLEELGLVAAGELGVRLDRTVMIETPSPDTWATVVAAVIEAFDIICLGPTDYIGHREAARLSARAREAQALLLHLDGGRSWPHALDAVLTVHPRHWSGIGAGHGHLQSRLVTITSTGRRSMAKPRQVDVLLPGPDGRLAPAIADDLVAATGSTASCENRELVGGEPDMPPVVPGRAGTSRAGI